MPKIRLKDPIQPAEKAPQIVAEWRTGEYTVREIANKHRVSIGFVAKCIKGVEKDCEQLVKGLVSAKQKLATLDEQAVHAVQSLVDKKTEHLLFFSNAAVQNVQQAMAEECTGQSDFKLRAETIAKGKEVCLGKDPMVNVQNNIIVSVADALRSANRC